MPRTKVPERFSDSDGAPVSARYPQIVGGTCEFCGVVDPNHKGLQYKICRHFKDMGDLACSYCDRAINQDDMFAHKVVNVADHPNNPDKVVVWCTNGNKNPGGPCEQKHLERFSTSI